MTCSRCIVLLNSAQNCLKWHKWAEKCPFMSTGLSRHMGQWDRRMGAVDMSLGEAFSALKERGAKANSRQPCAWAKPTMADFAHGCGQLRRSQNRPPNRSFRTRTGTLLSKSRGGSTSSIYLKGKRQRRYKQPQQSCQQTRKHTRRACHLRFSKTHHDASTLNPPVMSHQEMETVHHEEMAANVDLVPDDSTNGSGKSQFQIRIIMILRKVPSIMLSW